MNRMPEPSVPNFFTSGVWGALVALMTFALGAVAGAGVWYVSPRLTGEVQPWDFSLGLYVMVLLTAGVVLGLPTRPQYVFAGPLGLYAGQLAYVELFYHPRGAIILPAFISLAVFGLPPSAFGAACGAALRVVIHALATEYTNWTQSLNP
jgi:hypothetical protein